MIFINDLTDFNIKELQITNKFKISLTQKRKGTA